MKKTIFKSTTLIIPNVILEINPSTAFYFIFSLKNIKNIKQHKTSKEIPTINGDPYLLLPKIIFLQT